MSQLDKVERNTLKSILQQHGEGIAALSSGILILIAWLLSKTSESDLSPVIFLLAFVIGGFVKAREGILTLIKEREIDVNLLMLLAAIGAASIGYWTEGAILIFIFSLSGALETYTMARSHRDISALMDLKPETALLYQGGVEKVVPIESLSIGNFIIVKPGERIPADGVIKEGSSSIDQASITGESIPVDKQVNDEVFAGTLNGQGALIIEVTQSSESTLFAKIIRLVQEAQSEMPPSQRFIEKFERIYAKVIILVTILLMTVPYFIFDLSWSDVVYRAMVFMVVASPCALVASIMPAMLSAISNSAKKGILFKGGAHLENIAGVKVMTFDKTGTLTKGHLIVTDIIPTAGYSEEELLQVTASIEMLSEHPIAKAIVKKAQDLNLTLSRPQNLTALIGSGVEAEINGHTWQIGKPSFITGENEQWQKQLALLSEQGKTLIMVKNEAEVVGILALMDTLRTEAVETIRLLKSMGIQVAMLTGDHTGTAKAIASEAGVDLVFAELLPVDKVRIVKELKEKYGSVAMIGDGVNDAPALATANVGIAMGGVGSDAALETADIVLMKDDILKIPFAIRLGKRANSIVKQNIIFSLSVIAVLIIANFSQVLTLPFGVIGHEGSTILVILNGLRLLRSK